MTKTYPVISLNGFLYAIKDTDIVRIDDKVIKNGKLWRVEIAAAGFKLKHKREELKIPVNVRNYKDVHLDKIIASNDPSLTDVLKLPEIEDNIKELAKKFVESKTELIPSPTDEWNRNIKAYENFFEAGYKAASKKQYTEEDITKILEKFHRMNMAFLTGKEDDNLDIPEFVKSLNPIPKEVELEVEEYNARPDLGNFLAQPDGGVGPLIMKRLKLKDGYVIVKSVKY